MINDNSVNKKIVKKSIIIATGIITFFQNIIYGFGNILINTDENKDISLPEPLVEQNIEESCLINMDKKLSETEKNKLKIVTQIVFEILKNRENAREFTNDPKKFIENRIEGNINIDFSSRELKLLALTGDDKFIKKAEENDIEYILTVFKNEGIISNNMEIERVVFTFPVVALVVVVAASYVAVAYTVAGAVQAALEVVAQYQIAVNTEVKVTGGDDEKLFNFPWKEVNFLCGYNKSIKIYRNYLKQVLPNYLSHVSKKLGINEEDLKNKVYKELDLN